MNNPENDFAVGDFTIETTFGATPPAYISNTEIIIHKFINESGQYSPPGARALYRRPFPEGCSVQVYNESTSTSALTYKSQYANSDNSGSVYTQYEGAMSTIVLMEVGA